MKIQSKILAGFLLIIVIFLSISAIAIRSTQKLDATFSKLSVMSLPMSTTLQNIRYAAMSMNSATNELVVLTYELRATTNNSTRETIRAALVAEEEEFIESIKLLGIHLDDYRGQVQSFSPEKKQFSQKLHAIAQQLTEASQDMVRTARAGRTGDNILAQKELLEDLEHNFDEQIRLILTHESAELSEQVEDVHQQTYATSQLIFLCSALLVIIAFIAAMIISRRIARPIIKLQNAAQKVSQGQFETRITTSSRDEVGKLSTIFNGMIIEIEQLTNNMANMVEKRTTALTQTNRSLQNEVEERMIAEENARQTSSTMKNIFNNAIPLCITNTDFEIIQANEAYHALFGNKGTEQRPVKCYDSRPGPSCHTEKCPLQRILAGKKEVICEAQKEEQHQTQYFIVSARPFKDADGKITGIIESFQDITDRKIAENSLAEEKERLAITLQSIGDGVITTDTTGKVVLLNKIAQQLTGWSQEEAQGKPLEEVFHIVAEKDRRRHENPVEKVLRTGQNIELANHTILIAKDGWERFIADSGAPIFNRNSEIIGVVLVFRDVTEKQRMEEEITKVAKLQSIGILAGGIAHDFNNILTALSGNITLAKMYTQPDDKVHARLAKSENAITRAKDLTQQLLTFAKGGVPVRKIVSLTELIKDTVSFTLRGSKSSYDLILAEDLPQAEVDSGQINQVISNLIINADQAMTDGGTITIVAQNHEVPANDILPLPPGAYIKITIEDQGTGIPKDILPQIFDPYFTTKEDGSGLGLATAYSIINHHEGFISVESKAGRGTTFTIYLPASLKKSTGQQLPKEEITRGEGKILVMDDDLEIRMMIDEVLTTLGYSTTLTVDGDEALAAYREAMQSDRPFNAVILDLTIPGGMGGKETISRLLAINPQVKVIVSSGYSTDPVMANYKDYGFSAMVSKPYRVIELSQALKDILTDRNQ